MVLNVQFHLFQEPTNQFTVMIALDKTNRRIHGMTGIHGIIEVHEMTGIHGIIEVHEMTAGMNLQP